MLGILPPKRSRHPRVHTPSSLHQCFLDAREPRQRLRPHRNSRRSSSERLLLVAVARSRGDDDAQGPRRRAPRAADSRVGEVGRPSGGGSCRERRGGEESRSARLAAEASWKGMLVEEKDANLAEAKDVPGTRFAAHETVGHVLEGRAISSVVGRDRFSLLVLRQVGKDLCLVCGRRPESAVAIAAVPSYAESSSLRPHSVHLRKGSVHDAP